MYASYFSLVLSLSFSREGGRKLLIVEVGGNFRIPVSKLVIWFNGISILDGYLKPNTVYTCIYDS